MFQHNRLKNSFIILALALFMAGCAANLSTQGQLKQQSNVIMDTYHSAYVDVKTTLENPSSTPVQREMALKKRAILVQIWAVLGPYESILEHGGAINDADIQKINGLFDQLAALATTAVTK